MNVKEELPVYSLSHDGRVLCELVTSYKEVNKTTFSFIFIQNTEFSKKETTHILIRTARVYSMLLRKVLASNKLTVRAAAFNPLGSSK